MLLVTYQLDFISGFENPELGDFVDRNHPRASHYMDELWRRGCHQVTEGATLASLLG